MINKYLLSVITIVYNDVNNIEDTILSVSNLKYFDQIEYIVIDGYSTDGTADIIKKYDDKITYWISEKDHGIYDAMNKGIKNAHGMWINFMNSGDKFYEMDIIKKLQLEKNCDYNLLYGKKIIKNKTYEALSIKSLENGEIMACHQSMFFNKNRLKNELYYDIRYMIYGDYELVNRIYLIDRNRFKYFNIIITDYLGDGISSRISWQKRKEKYTIVMNQYGAFSILKILLLKIFR